MIWRQQTYRPKHVRPAGPLLVRLVDWVERHPRISAAIVLAGFINDACDLLGRVVDLAMFLMKLAGVL